MIGCISAGPYLHDYLRDPTGYGQRGRTEPELALGSWVAFKKTGDMTMVMGDLVLTEDEVTPPLSSFGTPTSFSAARQVRFSIDFEF